jgi:AraC family transcriptional regulator
MTQLLDCSGARIRRVVDPSRAIVAEHAHDWPMISLYVMGGYCNVTERGVQDISGPSMVFYGARVAHRNAAGEVGFEQVEIEFDPAWLGTSALPPQPILACVGGSSGALARSIALACTQGVREGELKSLLCRLLGLGRRERARPTGGWIDDVTQRLRAEPNRPIGELAREAGRSPAWIGPAYRHAAGEGLQEAAARFRVERAALLLRESDVQLSDVALQAGFCDQSHMNRTFRRVLGRLPTAVRLDRLAFRDG